MLHIHWDQAAGIWGPDRPAPQLLHLFEANPFAPITRFDINELGTWRPYSHDATVQALRRGRTPSVQLRGETPYHFEVDISRMDIADNLNLYIADEPIQRTDAEVLLTFMYQVALQMPRFAKAVANADPAIGDFKRQHQLPSLPLCFNLTLGWAHLLAESVYEYFYTREDLLHAPAYRVRERPGGAGQGRMMEIVVYSHPLDYDRPESRQRIIDLTRYLRDHERSHDDA